MNNFEYLKSVKMVRGEKTIENIKCNFEYYKKRGYIDILDAYTNPSSDKICIFNKLKDNLTKELNALLDVYNMNDYTLNVFIGGFNCHTFSIYFEIEFVYQHGSKHKYVIHETKSKRLGIKLY